MPCVCVAQVRRIDRRLKACHNPLLDPTSAAFRAEEAAREQAAADARQRKARPHLRLMLCIVSSVSCIREIWQAAVGACQAKCD